MANRPGERYFNIPVTQFLGNTLCDKLAAIVGCSPGIVEQGNFFVAAIQLLLLIILFKKYLFPMK